MTCTNAHILASVLTAWSRPAIVQITSTKLESISYIASMEQSIKSSGLVGHNYRLSNEIMPFINNSIDIIVTPMIERYVSQIPDSALPALAHSVVETAMQQPEFSLLDGLVTFSQDDMIELKYLLEKNLPITENNNTYTVIK